MKHAGFQHQALIYEGDDEYLAGTIPFLKAALEAGEPALVAAGPTQTDLLQGELGSDARGIRFLNMEDVGRNPALIIPLWREFADESGGRSVRGIGEPVWAACGSAALDECQRHESLLNVAFAPGMHWSLLCPYDAGSLSEDVLEKVAISHRRVHRAGGTEESASFEAELDCFAGKLSPPAAEPEVFHFGLAGLSEVRHRVAAVAERAGMESPKVAEVVTAASELAANSVAHGGGSGELRHWREDGELLVEIEDRGRIEEPLVGRLRPGITQEGGRGLWLANQLCDLVQIRSGEAGTTVRLHFVS
jgi:anti-sigma regulatory factor (Ser/Thr protein kinase)